MHHPGDTHCCCLDVCLLFLQQHHADAFERLLQRDPGRYVELLMVATNAEVPEAAEELLDIMRSHDKPNICSQGDCLTSAAGN
jgi:hypothetical protein